MEKRQFFTILNSYLENKLTRKERNQVDEWFDSFGYSTDIEPLRDEKKVKRIHRALNERLQRHIGQRQHGRRLNRWFAAAAACLVFAVLAWWVWPAGPVKYSLGAKGTDPAVIYDTVRTGPGKMKQIELPDRTVVWLNANSQIHYSGRSFDKDRDVFLDYGEAFFEVTENPEKPFVVHSKELDTKVLGTSFNIKDYPQLGYAVVQVKTGRVAVSSPDNTWQSMLTAGTGGKYDKNQQVFTTDNRTAGDAGSWKEGKILLDDATFAELALVMYNRFQITLKTRLPQASRFRYTMTILQNKPVAETMRLICDVHQTNYRRIGNEIIIY